ncbi:MAG TPA: DUF1080 domain-containing protein [Opitutaceae bacterium]
MRFPLILILVCLCSSAPAAEPELKPIFNGRDLAGWQSSGSGAFWRFEDGILIGENDAAFTGNMLRSEKSYGDFVIEFHVRWTGEIDSGIEFRQPVIQLQLGVSRSLKRDMSGSFYVGKPGYPEPGQAKDAAALMKPNGEWNTFRLRAEGSVFTVWINGTQAVQFTDQGFSGPAPLGFQIHSGLKMKVEYRNIRLAEL